jgi:hypothetical protein
MITKLPIWKGWTVDVRLRQFRKADLMTQEIEFLDFDSEEGDNLLTDMIKRCKDKGLMSKIYDAVC